MKYRLSLLIVLLIILVSVGFTSIAANTDQASASTREFLASTVALDPRSICLAVLADGSLVELNWDGIDLQGAQPITVAERVRAIHRLQWLTFTIDYDFTLSSSGIYYYSSRGFPSEYFISSFVKLLDCVVSVDASFSYAMALQSDGQLWFWGVPPSLDLERGITEFRPLRLMEDVQDFTASICPLIVKTDGSLWTFTASFDRETGLYSYTPEHLLDGVTKVKQDMAIDASGTLWRFGTNDEVVKLFSGAADMDYTSAYNSAGTRILDKSGNIWWIEDGKASSSATKIASNAAFLVAGGADGWHFYIDTNDRLCAQSVNGGAITVIDENVLYAVGAGSDCTLVFVKRDASLYAMKYGEGFSAPAKVLSGLMMAPPDGSPQIITQTLGTIFTDTAGHTAEQAVTRWADLGVFSGSGGLFRPDDAMTRAELAAILYRLSERDLRAPGEYVEGIFADVLAQLQSRDIMPRDASGNVYPLKAVTRLEAAEALAKLFGLDSLSDEFLSTAERGYAPYSSITRAELAELIDSLIKLYIPDMGHYGGLDGETQVIEGNVVINASAVSLANAVIKGDIFLMPGIGEYFALVELRNVTVEGTVHMIGNTLRLDLYNTSIARMEVNKTGITIVGLGDIGHLHAGADVSIDRQIRVQEQSGEGMLTVMD